MSLFCDCVIWQSRASSGSVTGAGGTCLNPDFSWLENFLCWNFLGPKIVSTNTTFDFEMPHFVIFNAKFAQNLGQSWNFEHLWSLLSKEICTCLLESCNFLLHFFNLQHIQSYVLSACWQPMVPVWLSASAH